MMQPTFAISTNSFLDYFKKNKILSITDKCAEGSFTAAGLGNVFKHQNKKRLQFNLNTFTYYCVWMLKEVYVKWQFTILPLR